MVARRNRMRVFYAVVFTLLVLALGVLEIRSSRAAARMANYPDLPAVSASPPMPGR
jgi:hypothetical protein